MKKSLSEARVFVNSLWRCLSILVVAAVTFNAKAADTCDETFSECREDCTLEFGGSVRDSMKAQHIECMKKCTKKLNLCAERRRETKASKLDDDALFQPVPAKKKPKETKSDEVDDLRQN